jgi:putative transposase
MARAHRLKVQGGIFHITHRWHNRAFLLKFARDREAYRAKMREALGQFEICLLNYTITRNHVHLLVDAENRFEVSGFIQKVAVNLRAPITAAKPG